MVVRRRELQLCWAAVGKADSGIIKKGTGSKAGSIAAPLCTPVMHPHLQYSTQFWSSHLQKEIEELEMVQRRAARLISAMGRD